MQPRGARAVPPSPLHTHRGLRIRSYSIPQVKGSAMLAGSASKATSGLRSGSAENNVISDRCSRFRARSSLLRSFGVTSSVRVVMMVPQGQRHRPCPVLPALLPPPGSARTRAHLSTAPGPATGGRYAVTSFRTNTTVATTAAMTTYTAERISACANPAASCPPEAMAWSS
jgi:hypothetical protein